MSHPVRLQKKVSRADECEAWILNHAYIFIPACFVILMILFLFLIYAITGVSAVESGSYYNHMQEVI